jgi:hypothetical protein
MPNRWYTILLGKDQMPKHSGKWVSYLCVSTDKQGKSGLGLEAQRKAVADFLNGGRWELLKEFVEDESSHDDLFSNLVASRVVART